MKRYWIILLVSVLAACGGGGQKGNFSEPTDRLVFGKPGRESMRYGVANYADLTSQQLLEALEYARKGVELTEAGLLARWEEKQKEKRERYRERWSDLRFAVGG